MKTNITIRTVNRINRVINTIEDISLEDIKTWEKNHSLFGKSPEQVFAKLNNKADVLQAQIVNIESRVTSSSLIKSRSRR